MSPYITARTTRIQSLLPMIRGIVKRLKVAEDLREDCFQAGVLSALQGYENWDADVSSWETFVAGSLKLSITRDIIREINRSAALSGAVPIETAELFDSDEEGEAADDGHLPTINDGNVELDRSKLMDQMIDAIVALDEEVERALMLLVLEGHTVSEAGRQLSLTQSAADRLYQRTVVKLKKSLKVE